MNPARRTVLSSLLLSLSFAAIGCGSAPRATTDTAHNTPWTAAETPKPGARRQLKDTPFERSWDLNLKQQVSGSWILPETPETLLLQLASHELVAIDTMSGHTRWVSMALPETLRIAPGASRMRVPGERQDVVVYDDRLYVVSQDIMFCFDMASGQLVWRYELPFSPSSAPRPVGVDSSLRVFLGDWAGRLQVVSYEMDKGFPYINWQFNLGTTLKAAPVEKEELVYVADGSGMVRAFKQDRQQVWFFKAGGNITGSPVVRDRVLFVGTSDHILYALDRLTGELLGQCNLNAPLGRTPFVFKRDNKRVYAWVDDAGSGQAGLHAFHAATDTVPFTDATRHPLDVVRMGQDWQLTGVDSLVGSTPGYLYLTGGGSTVVQAVNRETGSVDWTWDANEERRNEQLATGVRSGDVARVTSLVPYQDENDRDRSFYAIDEHGVVVAYRFFGFVPELVQAAGPTLPVHPKADKADKPADKADDKAADKPAAEAPKAQ